MAVVNTLSLGERLRELIPQLREVDAQLDEWIARLTTFFQSELPEGTYGCVLVSRPDRNHHCWTHLVYEEGALWVETWDERHGFHRETAVSHDIRENRIAVLKKLKELWAACGGDPLRFVEYARRPVLPWKVWNTVWNAWLQAK